MGGRKEYGGVGGAPGIFDAPNSTTAAASSSPHPFFPGIIIIFSSPPFPGGESAGCRRWNARYFREEVKGWAFTWCCDVSQQDIGFPLPAFPVSYFRVENSFFLFFFREIALGRSVHSFDKSAFGRHSVSPLFAFAPSPSKSQCNYLVSPSPPTPMYSSNCN